ncbi:hypothetical protein M885DRAFT_578380 [Pelagophyceae sp. CCMP2097]|nr:hypothetical protein M885DRAFT_578380 [Pelagophyceae sp. CCMP2097]
MALRRRGLLVGLVCAALGVASGLVAPRGAARGRRVRLHADEPAEPAVRRKKSRGDGQPVEPAKRKKSRGDGSAAPVAVAAPLAPAGPLELSFDFVNGGAYAVLETTTAGAPLRLLVDSGASRTALTAKAARETLAEKTLVLDAQIAPDTAFPAGVDGILGVDVLCRFKAVEFDWFKRVMRLHRASYAANPAAQAIPFKMDFVGFGRLPLVEFTAVSESGQSCTVQGVVDTGSPITIVTPELCTQAGLARNETDAARDVVAVGVDGEPTKLEATRCASVRIGAAPKAPSEAAAAILEAAPEAAAPPVPAAQQRVVDSAPLVFSGTVPMMAAIGWAGTAAVLVGLDLLASDGEGSLAGRLVLDFEAQLIYVEADISAEPQTAPLVAVVLDAGFPVIGEKASLRPSSGTFCAIDCSTSDGDLLLLVDTAATGCVLSRNAARRLGLPLQALPLGAAMTGAGGAAATTTVATLRGLALGRNAELCLPLVGAVVQDVDVLPEPLDGIVGLDVLQRFAAVDFDYAGRRFVFHAAAPPPPAVVRATGPLRRTALGVLATEFSVDVGEFMCELIVDTGAPASLLDARRGLKTLGVKPEDLAKLDQDDGAMGADGSVLRLTGRLTAKQVALEDGVNLLKPGETVDIDVGTFPVLDLLDTPADKRVGGVLGADVLLRSNVLRLDFLNMRLQIFDL